MKCSNCGEEVRSHERICVACGRDCGYPNVRAAEASEEIRVLENRVRAAEAAAASRGCEAELATFRDAVKTSTAVLSRSLGVARNLLSNDNELYATFYQLVGMGARRPEETSVERERLLADDLVFPHYGEHIRFAALSLDGRGLPHFGDCTLVLKDISIRERATVFEENSVYFCKKRNLGLRRGVPPGFRAVWTRRDELAAAKLENNLSPGTAADEFAGILMKSGSKAKDADFVEVHIYGLLHRRSVASVTVRNPTRRADRAILKEMERDLTAIGVKFETY